ncbi:2-keto-3-deoxy-L-rhamnonate aldolase RhmA [Angulomicrobium tetraedrale]|uniref:2-keto-3-deoxy-L-rhamnonate aldolase RhmA n=1 Tax=Ancylobacter tetraedralis TaxID=217068 RepID=A0A839Z7I2_9HYPH|nr:aldolase/citrate lyase family protein [Ancylobacter tetraedralis]MBB3770035.1 2-keto-3-deoxy-L-rhamnonate aldolase RhmA [Ancylobacter tetraedralis]
MAITPNHTKRRLAKGELALGLSLRQARTVDIGKIARASGFDFLFIDTEHSPISLDTVAQIAVAAQDAGVTPLVRPAGDDPALLARLLDSGAMGLIVPHVDTAEQARRIVDATLFAPIGRRAMVPFLPQLGFEALAPAKVVDTVNADTLIVVMLESPEAIANADAIATTRGVDVLMIGVNDLAAESGVLGETDHPVIREAFRVTNEACRRHGKIFGAGGLKDRAVIEGYIAQGLRFLPTGSDLGYFLQAASADTRHWRTVGAAVAEVALAAD